jgi:hypothetical protein
MMKGLAYTGVRKIAANVSWELPGDQLEHNLTYSDINYKQTKHKQLLRTYWNQEAVDAAIEKMKDRQGAFHTSVAIPLVNLEKKKTSQGHCMQTMVITHLASGYSSVDIYYRSTELIQKFLADMVFFSIMLPPVFKKMKIEPEVIRFKFANVYLSAVFSPIWIRYEDDLVGFFKDLESNDPGFFRRFGLATRRLLRENHNYGYRTQAAMFEYYKRYEVKKKTQQLRKILGSIPGGKPMEEENDN